MSPPLSDVSCSERTGLGLHVACEAVESSAAERAVWGNQRPADRQTRFLGGRVLRIFSLPELIGQKKSKLFVYHQNGLPKKYKVHELRE